MSPKKSLILLEYWKWLLNHWSPTDTASLQMNQVNQSMDQWCFSTYDQPVFPMKHFNGTNQWDPKEYKCGPIREQKWTIQSLHCGRTGIQCLCLCMVRKINPTERTDRYLQFIQLRSRKLNVVIKPICGATWNVEVNRELNNSRFHTNRNN